MRVLTVYGQSMTREEFIKLPKRETSNEIPYTNFISVAKDSVLIGQVISICDGSSSHWGPTIGVIKIKTTHSEAIFSVLTSDNKKRNFKVGMEVEILISPLTPTDKYYKPGTPTCIEIKGDKLCILKE